MHFVRLQAGETEAYARAMALYRESFPVHEQRRPASQREILGREEYQFNLIYDDTALVGLLLCWETPRFLYVEHFCIDPARRNRRYGQRALALLAQRGKTVILEIDPPVDPLSKRRAGFYQRAGFVENAFEHVHPPYRAGYGGHSLVVLSHPDRLTEEAYRAFQRYLRETVMDGALNGGEEA